MSEAPAIVLRFDTIVVAPEHAQTKRQILLSRGLGETFVVSGELPKELLDAVKILQMTELEVYFYEGDLDSVITPRTTMNSLIYLFKHLRELQRDFANTQYLQSINASMEKLGGFCDDFMRLQNPRTELLQSLLSSGDPLAVAFHDWVRAEGAICNVEIGNFSVTGRGLAVADRIDRNEVVLKIPWKMIFCIFRAFESPSLGDLLQQLSNAGVDEDTILLIFTIFEKFVNPKSYWKPYFDMLPQHVDSALYLTPDELDSVLANHPLQYEIRSIHEHLQTSFQQTYALISNFLSDTGLLEAFTWDNFVWGRSMFDSRGFHLDIAGKTYNCLLPLVDFLNNHNITLLEGSGRLQEPDREYIVRTLTPLQRGAQVFMNYGAFSHRELLLFYGYEIEGGNCNAYDVYPLNLDLDDDDGCGGIREEILRRCELSTEHYLKVNRPIPSKLLATINVIAMHSNDLQYVASLPSDTKVKEFVFNGIKGNTVVLDTAAHLIDALISNVASSSEYAADENTPLPKDFTEPARLGVNFTRVQLKILQSAKQQLASLYSK